MSDPHPLMMMLLNQSAFAGGAESVENEIMPLESQLTLTPGVHCMVAASNTPLERDFVMATMVDAEQHSGDFPDWEERMLNSYVLCEYWSRDDPDTHLGWFSRLKLVPITEEHYQDADSWRPDDWPHEMPDWATDYLRIYTDQLSDRAPERVPHVVSCPNCGERDVQIKVVRRLTYEARAGELSHEEQRRYVPLHELDVEENYFARLICPDCGSVAEMEDHEWFLPGITN
jgi:hypothetical protein